MGAWGEGPLENDNSLDFLDEHVLRPALQTLGGGRRPKIDRRFKLHYDEARASAWLLVAYVRAGGMVGAEDLDLAIHMLGVIADDDAYARDWREPVRFRKSIEAQLDELREAKTLVAARMRRRTKR